LPWKRGQFRTTRVPPLRDAISYDLRPQAVLMRSIRSTWIASALCCCSIAIWNHG
jgi:hypothetical protein